MDITEAKIKLDECGFLDLPISAVNDAELIAEINELRREKNAVVLAHYYQDRSIQDVADFIGDSLELSRKAATTNADIIVFCGVHFMAETAKILNPKKKVLIPDLKAGCSLSDSCPPDKFATFISQYPNAVVISYINCSAEIKALSNIICTSSNAELMVNSVSRDKQIIFAPDKNLGRYLEHKTNRQFILWDGACMVHENFALQQTQELIDQHPEAKFIAHPESETAVLDIADFIGSTSQLLKFIKEDDAPKYIVATESGIFHQMQKVAPEKTFLTAACNTFGKKCICGECMYMKKNSLQKLLFCLKYELPEIKLEEELRLRALKSMNKMLDLSKSIK